MSLVRQVYHMSRLLYILRFSIVKQYTQTQTPGIMGVCVYVVIIFVYQHQGR